MPTKTRKTAASPSTAAAEPKVVPEADFDDTIAKNRALPLLDLKAIPAVPKGFRATEPDARNRRLRKIAGDHRAECRDALREAVDRDLKEDLGKHAPDPARAPALLDRLTTTGALVTATAALAAYAREMEQIALSDALVFLEAEHRELIHALEHEPSLAPRYAAVRALFSARGAAISNGLARAAKAASANDKAEEGAEEEPAPEAEGEEQ